PWRHGRTGGRRRRNDEAEGEGAHAMRFHGITPLTGETVVTCTTPEAVRAHLRDQADWPLGIYPVDLTNSVSPAAVPQARQGIAVKYPDGTVDLIPGRPWPSPIGIERHARLPAGICDRPASTVRPVRRLR